MGLYFHHKLLLITSPEQTTKALGILYCNDDRLPQKRFSTTAVGDSIKVGGQKSTKSSFKK